MAQKVLNVPSAQHLARNWRERPEMIANELVRLFDNTPMFNYNALVHAVRDYLVFGVPFDDVERGIREKVKRETVRNNFLEILPLLRRHFENEKPDFVNAVSPRFYPLARGADGKTLSIPFKPPMVYGVGGKLVFPWFIFWRKNPLKGEKFSLFVSVVKEILAQDPDLEDAEFQILDFSSVKPDQPRILRSINANDVPEISVSRRNEMLEQFSQGFFLAQERIAERQEKKERAKREQERREEHDPRQQSFF